MPEVLASTDHELAGPDACGRYPDDLGQNVNRIDEEIFELLPEVSPK
jgi:hypothetical protein